MGLTKSSTGNKVISDIDFAKKCNFKVTLAGNPNTGKSTIFNSLTKMHQHTGNWTGKTVENAAGISSYKNQKFLFVLTPERKTRLPSLLFLPEADPTPVLHQAGFLFLSDYPFLYPATDPIIFPSFFYSSF